MLPLLLMLALTLTPGAASSQASQGSGETAQQPAYDDDFKVYTEAPRLFLNAKRLKLLRRERERESMRWQQFQLLMNGKAVMPEPGLASCLYFQITSDSAAAKPGIEYALSAKADLRQQAIVFDWCAGALTEPQSDTLAAKLEQGIGQTAKQNDVAAVSARTLAAIALAERKPDLAEQTLRATVQQWWRGHLVDELKRGMPAVKRDDVLPLFEMMHAVRDNVNIELRDPVPGFFKDLPAFLLLSYYPNAYPAAENEYRIPLYYDNAEPDLRRATLSRAAEFAMVAYDNNALESQFLQGWLLQDRYLMRSPLGIVYEVLWANPYQPGLSYFHLPLTYRDAKRQGGGLLLRSSWEDDAVMFTYVDGKAQVFEDGKRKTLELARIEKPLRVGDAAVLSSWKFKAELPLYYVTGLKAGGLYDVEIDGEEMKEMQADAGGILELTFAAGVHGSVRIHPAKSGAPKS